MTANIAVMKTYAIHAGHRIAPNCDRPDGSTGSSIDADSESTATSISLRS
jgi:hypothetical protein